MKNAFDYKIIVLSAAACLPLFSFNHAKADYTTMPPPKMETPPTVNPPRVEPPPNTTPAKQSMIDSDITMDIQSKIASDTSLSGLGVIVSTNNGVVTLEGTVNNQTQADVAVSIAKSIGGVADVQSKIYVKPPTQ